VLRSPQAPPRSSGFTRPLPVVKVTRSLTRMLTRTGQDWLRLGCRLPPGKLAGLNWSRCPFKNWNSSELESFLRKYFYGNRTFREVLSEPLFFLVIIPFILLFGVILMKREIVEEWRQLYAGPFGDDLIFDMPVLWRRCRQQMNDWKGCLIANTKTGLSSRRSEPKEQALVATNTKGPIALKLAHL
jgi:hypothetical protein